MNCKDWVGLGGLGFLHGIFKSTEHGVGQEKLGKPQGKPQGKPPG